MIMQVVKMLWTDLKNIYLSIYFIKLNDFIEKKSWIKRREVLDIYMVIFKKKKQYIPLRLVINPTLT